MKKIQQREIFADMLRCIAIISVLYIHTTANYYVSSYGNRIFPVLFLQKKIP